MSPRRPDRPLWEQPKDRMDEGQDYPWPLRVEKPLRASIPEADLMDLAARVAPAGRGAVVDLPQQREVTSPMDDFMNRFHLPPWNFHPKNSGLIEQEGGPLDVASDNVNTNIISFTIPMHTSGVIRWIGYNSGTFASNIFWSLLLSDSPVFGWTEFNLQRGTVSAPKEVMVPVHHEQRIIFRVRNNSGAQITVSAYISGWFWPHAGHPAYHQFP